MKKKYSAYSLQETLIVLVIIGILILIALPNLMPLINRAKSIEAQTQLKHVYSLQRAHKMTHSVYSSDLQAIGFAHQKTINEGGDARYLITIQSADKVDFIARAESLEDADGDGVFNIWEIDKNGKPTEIQPD